MIAEPFPSRRMRRTLALVAVPVMMSCDDTLSPEDRLSVRVDSEHLIYRTSPGDEVDTTWMESYWQWLTTELGAPPQRLEYHKYRDREHLKRVTDRTTNGFAEPGTPRFHTIWPFDNHEIVHALVNMTMGHPPALFNEGIAVAHQSLPPDGVLHPQWNLEHVHDIAWTAVEVGHVPAVEYLLESTDFFSRNPELMYPVSGSFIRWLLDEHGLEAFRTFIDDASFNQSASTTRAQFLAAYGLSVDLAWERWKAFLYFRSLAATGAQGRPGAQANRVVR